MKLGRLLALGLFVGLAACEEELTVPGQCPEFCPPGLPELLEVVIPAQPASDTAFVGYVGLSSPAALLVSDGLPAGEARAWYRFPKRPDSITVRDSLNFYTVDSVAFEINLIVRDTLVLDLSLLVHRVPLTWDTLTSFAEVDAALTDETVLDTLPVPDTLRTGPLRLVVSGDALDKLVLDKADSNKLAIGLQVRGAVGTGVRLGSVAGTSGAARFITYAHVPVTDTAIQKQTINLTADTNAYVFEPARTVDPDLLYLGGLPAARTIVRFQVPAFVLDSAEVVRATLELTPAQEVNGLPNDIASLEARTVTADLGAKSTPTFTLRALTNLPTGTSGVIGADVLPILNGWRAPARLPQMLYLSITPEAGSFHMPVFRSTRSPEGGGPQLRIAYMRRAALERP